MGSYISRNPKMDQMTSSLYTARVSQDFELSFFLSIYLFIRFFFSVLCQCCVESPLLTVVILRLLLLLRNIAFSWLERNEKFQRQ